jgi:quercetin dioxygenase-like cupin family protein
MYKRLPQFILALFCLVIISSASIKAQDVVKVVPKKYKVTLDNDKVRVLDNTSNPGDVSDWHSHPDMLVYVLEGGTIKSETKDGKTVTTVFKKGETLFREATTHKTTNIGKTKLHLLLIELKK